MNYLSHEPVSQNWSTSLKNNKQKMQKLKATLLHSIRVFLRLFDIGVARYDQVEELLKNPRAQKDLRLFCEFPDGHIAKSIRLLESSRSQLRQDLVVLSYLQFKKNGFFVEFGAADGLVLSNTYLLESQFSWTGILAEPAKTWHRSLSLNRRCCIDHRCVWKKSNESIDFYERDFKECSGVQRAKKGSEISEFLLTKKYSVTTVSLNDLLEEYSSPKIIDYLSIDTEGSEFEILNSVNFNNYIFRFISCEHNFSSNREKVFQLLSSKGYSRVLQIYSEFDDWYIYRPLAAQLDTEL
jgi:FkbM family methyltransferase